MVVSCPGQIKFLSAPETLGVGGQNKCEQEGYCSQGTKLCGSSCAVESKTAPCGKNAETIRTG